MAEPDNLKVSTSVVVDLAAERFGRLLQNLRFRTSSHIKACGAENGRA